MKFIQLTTVYEEEDKIIKTPALISIDVIDSFRLDEGKLLVRYKGADKDGKYWCDTLDNKASEISKALEKAGLLIKIEPNEPKKT